MISRNRADRVVDIEIWKVLWQGCLALRISCIRCVVLFLLAAACNAQATDFLAPRINIINHVVKSSEHSSVFLLNTKVTDDDDVASVQLYYKLTSDIKYLTVEFLELGNNEYAVEVEIKQAHKKLLDYYIQASDKTGNKLLRGNPFSPLKIIIPKPKVVEELVNLTINVIPADARIRIMNIQPRYRRGMVLKKGISYDIYITRDGYKSWKQTIQLRKKLNVLDINLEKIPNTKKEIIEKTSENVPPQKIVEQSKPKPSTSEKLSDNKEPVVADKEIIRIGIMPILERGHPRKRSSDINNQTLAHIKKIFPDAEIVSVRGNFSSANNSQYRDSKISLLKPKDIWNNASLVKRADPNDKKTRALMKESDFDLLVFIRSVYRHGGSRPLEIKVYIAQRGDTIESKARPFDYTEWAENTSEKYLQQLRLTLDKAFKQVSLN